MDTEGKYQLLNKYTQYMILRIDSEDHMDEINYPLHIMMVKQRGRGNINWLVFFDPLHLYLMPETPTHTPENISSFLMITEDDFSSRESTQNQCKKSYH